MGERAHTSELLLERLIHKDASRLDHLCQELRETRKDLAAFLDDYYRKVGQHVASLASLQHKTPVAAQHETREDASPLMAWHMVSRAEAISATALTESVLDQEARALYLMLAKKYHPDTAPQGGDTALLASINHAYEQRHIGSLWKIMFTQEWLEISKLPVSQRMKLLDHYHAHIRRAANIMESRLRQLHTSPEYLLFERIFKARLRGEDLLGEIVRSLEEELCTQSRRIAYRRFRDQLLQECS